MLESSSSEAECVLYYQAQAVYEVQRTWRYMVEKMKLSMHASGPSGGSFGCWVALAEPLLEMVAIVVRAMAGFVCALVLVPTTP